MALETKSAELKKLDDSGKGEALFVLWEREDLDGDVTHKGAFGNHQEPWLLPHHLWANGSPPLGKGVIVERREGAVFEFELNTELEAARSWLSHLRFDLSKGTAPKQAWSYGFRVAEGGFTPRPGQKGRELHARPDGQPGVLVVEVSPVTAAAQPLSRTLTAKNLTAQQEVFREMHRRCLDRGRLMRDILALEHAIAYEEGREDREQVEELYRKFTERQVWLERQRPFRG